MQASTFIVTRDREPVIKQYFMSSNVFDTLLRQITVISVTVGIFVDHFNKKKFKYWAFFLLEFSLVHVPRMQYVNVYEIRQN